MIPYNNFQKWLLLLFVIYACNGKDLDNDRDVRSVDLNQNVWENSNQWEGDIVLSSSQMSRNGVPKTFLGFNRWPFKTLVYAFASSISKNEMNAIEDALKDFSKYTCVKTRRKIFFDFSYVWITNKPNGCYSMVGRIGGAQPLNLQNPGCTSKGTILHEFLHAFGFWHMHSDPSRDKYVEVFLQNVSPLERRNFAVQITADNYGVLYDKQSIMHYSNFAFSMNGKPTIQSKSNRNEVLGGRVLTEKDIQKLKKMYNCWL